MSVPTANWSYPTAVKFGPGRIRELADHCKAVGIRKPLLVTDKALASLPITARALDILDAAGLGRAVFSEVDPNPNEMNMAAGLKVYRAGGHDGVVCFGGGSALDLGKMIALMVDQTIPVWDLEDIGDWWTRADAAKIAPIIAVPTTAGTGSEVGRAGVLTLGHDLRPGTDGRDAEVHHRRHRHGRARPLPGGLFQPLLPPDEPGHRAGRDAAGVREPAQGLRRRQ
jgi:alcohol dehydrogenase class IV